MHMALFLFEGYILAGFVTIRLLLHTIVIWYNLSICWKINLFTFRDGSELVSVFAQIRNMI